jgi:DNA-binding Lrp family transcriptional regulator
MDKPKIDSIDRQILNKMTELQTVKHALIAKEIGQPIATVNKRINKMIKYEIIEGFSPIINMKNLGYNVTAVIDIRVKYDKAIDALAEFAKEPNVCAVYKITGDCDVAVIAKFKNTDELDHFNERFLRNQIIERTNTSIVFSAKKEGSTPNIIG